MISKQIKVLIPLNININNINTHDDKSKMYSCLNYIKSLTMTNYNKYKALYHSSNDLTINNRY